MSVDPKCTNSNSWKNSAKWFKAAKTVGIFTGSVAMIGCGWYLYQTKVRSCFKVGPVPAPAWTQNPIPSRESQMKALKTTSEFDLLVIGGGATGCGVALDAVSRGLKVALVEKYDFSSGTSSRSTKLIHGGVRYLQKAIMSLDWEQFNLVQEALSERANLLNIAPHLSFPLPIMLPVYEWWQVPYFWAGIKMYDQVSGSKKLKSSFLLSKTSALEKFPMLKADKLKAAIVYYDGSHNDSRMNLSIAITAARQGACVANYCEVIDLLRGNGDHLTGAKLVDRQTGEQFEVKAKAVVNATGPFTDVIRKMDNQKVEEICQPSAGVHVVLPGYYSPDAMGLLDPSTSDGRVIFFLPWQGLTIAGTTDSPCKITSKPAPRECDVTFILQEIRNYLNPEVRVRRGDVQSAWSGIRPLVTNPNARDTQSISRNHVVEVSPSHLITIAGGKWTTYRKMAEDCVESAIKICGLKASNKSTTLGMRLEGGHKWTPNHFIKLAQTYGLDASVAKHLSETYGDRADDVAKLASVTGKRHPIVGRRLAEDFPYIEAEVRYAMKEYARSVCDVLALRTRLAFLSVDAAEESLPRVLKIMSKELNWDEERINCEREQALHMIHYEMGKKIHQVQPTSIHLTPIDVERFTKKFRAVDREDKGFITRVDIEHLMKEMEIDTNEEFIQSLIDAVDLNKNGKLELDEFLVVSKIS